MLHRRFEIRGRSITRALESLAIVICPSLVPATLQSLCSPRASVSSPRASVREPATRRG